MANFDRLIDQAYSDLKNVCTLRRLRVPWVSGLSPRPHFGLSRFLLTQKRLSTCFAGCKTS